MIRFLVNPAAGSGAGARHLGRLRALAAEAGAEVAVSASPEDLTVQARRAVEEGAERLVVVGGDGTLHYALQGLAGSSCALAPVPLGRGNDLAATLGAPRRLEAAVKSALTREVSAIDLVRAGDRFCAVYAGAGFDGEVTACANTAGRRFPGNVGYVYAVVRTLIDFVPPRLRVEHDGGVFDGPAMFVTAANCPRFGGGMRIAPDASPDDGWLDLVIVQAVPRRTLLAVFPRVYRGRHVGHPAITIVRTRRAHLTLDRETTLYGDGEALFPLGEGGVELEVIPGGLAVVRSGQP